MSDTAHAVEYLRATLPSELSSAIDWTRVHGVAGHFVDRSLRERFTDRLFAGTVGERAALLYVLCEHQSSEDSWMPFRVLVYLVRIWEHWRRENPRAKKLPVIVPLVVHQGRNGWRTARHLSDLYNLEPAERACFGDVLPNAGFLLDDLGSATDDALQRRAVGPCLRLALASLARVSMRKGPRFVQTLELFAQGLASLPEPSSSQLQLLDALLEYLLRTRDEPAATLTHSLARHLPPPAQETLMTAAERLIQEGKKIGRLEGKRLGRAEGKRLGRAEGKKLGEHQGRIALLTTVLRGRGLEPTPELLQRLAACSIAELDRLALRAGKVRRAEDLFSTR